jgi:hypothetical protein
MTNAIRDDDRSPQRNVDGIVRDRSCRDPKCDGVIVNVDSSHPRDDMCGCCGARGSVPVQTDSPDHYAT